MQMQLAAKAWAKYYKNIQTMEIKSQRSANEKWNKALNCLIQIW